MLREISIMNLFFETDTDETNIFNNNNKYYNNIIIIKIIIGKIGFIGFKSLNQTIILFSFNFRS